MAAGWNEAERGGLVRQLVGQSAEPQPPLRDVHFGEKGDDEMCICYFQVATRSFPEMVMLEDDMSLYIGELMEQYRQGMARRRGTIARRAGRHNARKLIRSRRVPAATARGGKAAELGSAGIER